MSSGVVVSCFCRHQVPMAASDRTGDQFTVVVCPRCHEPWAVWVHNGGLASQVNIRPGMTYAAVMKRLGLYGVRVLAQEWESPEARALFVSKWTARRRWEDETRWGRRIAWLFGLPLVRLLNRPPLWLKERIWRRWFEPEHLDIEVPLTPSDRAHIARLNRGSV